MWGEAERDGSVQPGEEKAQGDLISVYKYLTGELKKIDPDTSKWCPLTGQDSMDTKRNTGSSV